MGMIEKCSKAVIEWLVRLCICYQARKVPENWKRSCTISDCKRKGDSFECKNYRGISLLSIPGNVYVRIIIQRVTEETKNLIRDGRGCVSQVFSLEQVSSKAWR